MVKRDWIVRYVDLPPPSERRLTLQSWDTASKGGPDNDWSVCTTWIVTRRKEWYLADVWRRRVDYPKAAVQALAKHWKARRVLVEDAGAGTSLVQELRGRVSGIIAVKPVGDKVSRMMDRSLTAGSYADPFAPKPAGRLSRKEWHSGANGAVL